MTQREDSRRDDLIRLMPGDGSLRFSEEDARPLLFGYPVVFNTYTEINSLWEGNFRERIMPGALDKTLRERGGKIKVLFNHGMDPNIGDKPLGKPNVQRADGHGLYVEVPLDDTSYNRDLIESLRSGALDGMSFRFSVIEEVWNEEPEDGGLPTRDITELRLYEYGPVTFPAYDATTVGVRSQDAYTIWKAMNSDHRREVVRSLGGDPSVIHTPDTVVVDTPDETQNDKSSGSSADSGLVSKQLTKAERMAKVSTLFGVRDNDPNGDSQRA